MQSHQSKLIIVVACKNVLFVLKAEAEGQLCNSKIKVFCIQSS